MSNGTIQIVNIINQAPPTPGAAEQHLDFCRQWLAMPPRSGSDCETDRDKIGVGMQREADRAAGSNKGTGRPYNPLLGSSSETMRRNGERAFCCHLRPFAGPGIRHRCCRCRDRTRRRLKSRQRTSLPCPYPMPAPNRAGAYPATAYTGQGYSQRTAPVRCAWPIPVPVVQVSDPCEGASLCPAAYARRAPPVLMWCSRCSTV